MTKVEKIILAAMLLSITGLVINLQDMEAREARANLARHQAYCAKPYALPGLCVPRAMEP